MYRQAHCLVCPDKRKVKTKESEARRILSRVRKLHQQLPEDFAAYEQQNSYLCHTPVHTACGYCPPLAGTKNSLQQVERELNSLVVIMKEYLVSIKDTQPETYKKLKYQLMQQLRGFYPRAVKYLLYN
jgi:hypothetical protein